MPKIIPIETQIKIQKILQNPKWQKKSLRAIAAECGVSRDVILRIRDEMVALPPGTGGRNVMPATTAPAVPTIDASGRMSLAVPPPDVQLPARYLIRTARQQVAYYMLEDVHRAHTEYQRLAADPDAKIQDMVAVGNLAARQASVFATLTAKDERVALLPILMETDDGIRPATDEERRRVEALRAAGQL